jgi:Vacuolar sorting protein 9 (VPS9) domain
MVFAKLQEAELPFEKLDFLLSAVTMILDNTVDPDSENSDVRHFGCDDFLPLLAYVICKCGFHFAEIEAEYMWGLLQPTLMIGQVGYYVTSLCSAAISLKEFKMRFEMNEGGGGAVVVSTLDTSIDSGYPASI